MTLRRTLRVGELGVQLLLRVVGGVVELRHHQVFEAVAAVVCKAICFVVAYPHQRGSERLHFAGAVSELVNKRTVASVVSQDRINRS